MKRFIFIALALIISTVGLYAENYIYVSFQNWRID